MKPLRIFASLLALMLSGYAHGQFNLYDPDIQSFTAKGDSFYVETEIISMTKHRKIKPGDTRIYTWVLGGQIQSNQGGYTGRLLHGDYTSINNDRTMREQGTYWYGLKDGFWKYWHPNGRMKKSMTWHRGELQGDFADFDENGSVIKCGRYRNNKLQGKVYYYTSNTPVKVEYYEKGVMKKYLDLTKVDHNAHPVVSYLQKLFKKKTEVEGKNDSKDVRRK